jgi:hypothetical protein
VCVRFRDQGSELRGDVCGVRAFEPDQESRVWLLRLPKFVGQETGCRSLPSRGHGARVSVPQFGRRDHVAARATASSVRRQIACEPPH